MNEKEIEKKRQEILKQQEALDAELKALMAEKAKDEDISFGQFFIQYRMLFFVAAFIISFLLIGFGIASFAQAKDKGSMIMITAGGLIFLVLIICWPIVNHIANKDKKDKENK